eukprot:13356169-Heterocapsa_arctica.AAC.1
MHNTVRPLSSLAGFSLAFMSMAVPTLDATSPRRMTRSTAKSFVSRERHFGGNNSKSSGLQPWTEHAESHSIQSSPRPEAAQT